MKNIERGAMKQALEALESTYKVFHEDEEIEDAITSLRQAIAEAEQCKYPNCDYPCMNLPDCNYVIKWSDYESNGRIIKEQPAQPETEHEPDDLTIAYLSGFYDGRKKRE